MKKCSCGKKVKAKGLCAACYSKEWREKNKEYIRDYNKRYREANKEYYREHNKRWHRENRDYVAKRQREYYRTDSGREAVKKAVRKYEKKNKHRRKAWGKVNSLEQKPCEVCGKLPTHKHHEDYDKPKEIVYLCPLHHKQAHNGI